MARRRLAVRLRVCRPDLLRLLGLYRHRARVGKAYRRRAYAQFQYALSCRVADRVLAPLAYFPFDLAPGLFVHPTWRKPLWPGDRIPKPHGYDGAWRAVARRGNPVHRVGHMAWVPAGPLPNFSDRCVSRPLPWPGRKMDRHPAELPSDLFWL